MNTERKVVEALELAANRLHEPPVLGAYQQLVALVDSQLGGQVVAAGSALTEPQLVLIAYGLRHVRGAHAAPMTRAADALIEALSTVYVPPAAPPPPQTLPEETAAAPARSPAKAITRRMRISNHFGNVKNTNLTIAGNQFNYAPPPTVEIRAEESADDEPEPAEPAPTVAHRYDVFLSYSRPNAEKMRRLKSDLRAAGLDVWTDDNLNIGTPSWKRAIEDAIRRTRSLVVIMTPESKNSEWVERELNSAKAHNKPIFPVLARGNSKNAIPFMLNSYQYIDLRREPDYRAGVQKLVKAIKAELRQR
jgi:hypothetical protein